MQISKLSASGVTPFQFTTLVTSTLPSLRVLVTLAAAVPPLLGTATARRGHGGRPLGLGGLGDRVAARDQVGPEQLFARGHLISG